MERLDCRLNKNPEKKNDLRSWGVGGGELPGLYNKIGSEVSFE